MSGSSDFAERPCVGCGARVADVEGPTHRYVVASPGCWARFNELGTRWWTPAIPGASPGVQRIAVDAYMVQHPGLPDDTSVHRQAIQSVAVHLVGLYLSVERNIEPVSVTKMIQRLLASPRTFPLLEPPPSLGEISILDVVGAPDARLVSQVQVWARSSWAAWSTYHERVQEWGDAVA